MGVTGETGMGEGTAGNFRSETSAVVVRLRTAAPHAYMREFAFIGVIAAILLKLVADLVLVKLLMKVC